MCPAPTIINATVDGTEIEPNATVKITCDEPYALNHHNDLVCISNNTFEPSVLPSCVRKYISSVLNYFNFKPSQPSIPFPLEYNH